MSDMIAFLCLGATVLSAIFAGVAAYAIVISGKGSWVSAVVVGALSPLGFVCTLPFGRDRAMTWLPALAAAYFGALVLTSILCYLSDIRDAVRARRSE